MTTPTPQTDALITRHAALLVMAKMALIDGNFSRIEEMFLAAMAGTTSLDQLLEEARATSLEGLCAGVPRYEDRFFIAVQAYSMAHIDQCFDSEEKSLFSQLIKALCISSEDRELIEQIRSEAETAEAPTPPPRFQELFSASSFADTPLGKS